MEIEKLLIKSDFELNKLRTLSFLPDLLFIFGDRKLLSSEKLKFELADNFASSILFGCSSSGEISGLEVVENSLSITAIKFDTTKIKFESVIISKTETENQLGKRLVNQFDINGLRHIMVLADGMTINGAELVKGLQEELPNEVSITGGLAGDGDRFEETVVFNKKGKPVSNCVSAIGFYGDNLSIGYGSNGGWDSFGMERLVTKSKANILYELDGKPALKLYKEFLDERAKDLPASGLLFPLSLRENGTQEPVVRTILGINEENQSLIFAGNIPEGATVKLMKANVDRLINGAEKSALNAIEMIPKTEAELAVLISCVGRKLVLKQLTEEEVEAVADVIGKNVNITGFYSYGEISPFRQDTPCMLHNQTMTITTISER